MGSNSKTLVATIKKNVLITDMADEYGISLTRISSGNFTHRCKCPNKDHKMGGENTDSLYIDSVNNDFYCYGCSAGSSCIDFFMICNGVNFSEAISVMSDYVEFDGDENFRRERAFDDFAIKLEISKTIREYCQSHHKDKNYFAKLSLKIDDILSTIKHDDYKKLTALSKQIKKHLNRRYE